MSAGGRHWLLFALVVAIALSALGWLTARVLALAGEEERSRAHVAQEQAARRALWRLDSTLTPLLVAAGGSAVAADQAGAPLLPVTERLQLPLAGAKSGEPPLARAARAADDLNSSNGFQPQQQFQNEAFPAGRQGSFDFQARQQTLFNADNLSQRLAANTQLQAPAGPLGAAWVTGRLALLRRVHGPQGDHLLVMLVDWEALTARLQAIITDLLPSAQFRAREQADANEENGYALATLPIVLVPGPAAPVAADGSAGATAGATIRLALVVAWTSVLAAIAVLGVLTGQALALSERRATFVSAVTHELRTPITSLRLYADMLSSGMAEEPQRRAEYLATIRAEAERLGRLVENVLAFARLGSAPAVSAMPCALGELVERCREALERRAREAGMELSIVLAAQEQRQVLAATDQVERILFNLVDNACKYAAGATDRRIEIGATAAPGRLGVSVRDFGPGVAPAMRARLFQPFSRSAAEAAGGAPGVGLGLALARALARSLGGELVLSEVPGGACFILWLRTPN